MSNKYGPRIVTDGLVLCLDAADRNSYPGSGSTWYDLKGNHNATVTGGSPTYRNLYGGVFDFDGTDDYMTISDPGSLNTFSVAVWVYPLLNSTGDAPSIIASKYPSYVNFQITYLNNNTVRMGIFNGAWAWPNFVSVNNGWQHLCFTYDGPSSALILYRNGVGIISIVSNITAFSSGTGIHIGRRWDIANYFNGYISKIELHNRALSPDDVVQNYNATKGRFGL